MKLIKNYNFNKLKNYFETKAKIILILFLID